MQLIRVLSILLLSCLEIHLNDATQVVNDNITNIMIKSELSDDIDDDYTDYVDENEVSKQTRQRNQSSFDRVGTFYSWDRWEKWSKCSTTCVQIKQRKCLERFKNSTMESAVERRFYPGSGQTGCSGVLKRYRQCKEERCKPGKQRLRDEQCEKFNNVPYRETFYNWVGYEKEHDECMLFCRATNSDLFISMNQSVTDGTPCNRPAVYYTHFYRRQAVCVEGICRAVHSSGLIRPVTTRDSPVKCGSVMCKHVSVLFNKTNPTKGYNLITKLPVGAMNLAIKQNIRSNNSLALKSAEEVFLIPRDRLKIFSFNDNAYEYNQLNALLTSRGPLAKAVMLMHFVLDAQSGLNDIQYNYTIPIASSTVNEEEELQAIWDESGKLVNDTDASYAQRMKERKRRRFSWKLLGFGECNRSCGPGTQTPIFRCVLMRESLIRYYSPRRCADIEKPTFNDDIYNCNRGLCPAFWRPSNFSNCECPTGSSIGLRRRNFECMQEQIKGNVELVPDKLCPVRDTQAEPCRCLSKH
ncbi:PREDICTED: A disintegrin and metalloproteinase with thrombospondin motifs 18-like [Drosophila arizonae]|uniref:A disintegrin and metalloproteinase with thrombospondin motifs 18-like n=1 Tax=Drosophila arizonae TaxID=7263 RepID=A0ABM1NUY7_DROAR|nr:PREDICTED: A disintegrin and metalloproteinase with thrombospondin motifs 18-like [Drosophila arizonae]